MALFLSVESAAAYDKLQQDVYSEVGQENEVGRREATVKQHQAVARDPHWYKLIAMRRTHLLVQAARFLAFLATCVAEAVLEFKGEGDKADNIAAARYSLLSIVIVDNAIEAASAVLVNLSVQRLRLVPAPAAQLTPAQTQAAATAKMTAIMATKPPGASAVQERDWLAGHQGTVCSALGNLDARAAAVLGDFDAFTGMANSRSPSQFLQALTGVDRWKSALVLFMAAKLLLPLTGALVQFPHVTKWVRTLGKFAPGLLICGCDLMGFCIHIKGGTLLEALPGFKLPLV